MLSPATSPWSHRRPDFRYLCEVVSLINRQINLVFVRFLVSSIFALPFLAATLERHRKSFFCQACGRWANERMNIWLTLWSLNRPFPRLSTEQCFIFHPIKLISRWQLKRFFVLLTRIVNRHFTWIRLFFLVSTINHTWVGRALTTFGRSLVMSWRKHSAQQSLIEMQNLSRFAYRRLIISNICAIHFIALCLLGKIQRSGGIIAVVKARLS